MIDLLTFGQRLRHFRRQRGMTLDALGAIVGKPAPYLSNLENGKREPKLGLINALAGRARCELRGPPRFVRSLPAG